MKENCNTCDPCEENFWNEVKEIVDNVKNYTKKKRKRCRTLFPKKKAKTANNCPRKNGNKAFPQGEQTYRAKTKEEGTFSRSFFF